MSEKQDEMYQSVKASVLQISKENESLKAKVGHHQWPAARGRPWERENAIQLDAATPARNIPVPDPHPSALCPVPSTTNPPTGSRAGVGKGPAQERPQELACLVGGHVSCGSNCASPPSPLEAHWIRPLHHCGLPPGRGRSSPPPAPLPTLRRRPGSPLGGASPSSQSTGILGCGSQLSLLSTRTRVALHPLLPCHCGWRSL